MHEYVNAREARLRARRCQGRLGQSRLRRSLGPGCHPARGRVAFSGNSTPLITFVDPSRQLTTDSHRRRNALTGNWVLVSPGRNARPWQGMIEPPDDDRRPPLDPRCYLCPGSLRAGGARNPDYAGVHVFDNDFPALAPGDGDPADDGSPGSAHEPATNDLLVAARETGRCRVIAFSPRHDLTIPELDGAAVRAVVDSWAEEYARLAADPAIGYVQIFENKGSLMGCSNPHPHGQIWAQGSMPNEPAREGARFAAHLERRGRTLLDEYLELELRLGERVVCANDAFVALVPFWAVWPFETLVVSRRAVPDLVALTDAERDGLADILRRLTTRYDNLFATSFPYSAGIHQAPTDGLPHPEWHLHLHFLPPLLRSASVRKFLVGYEMLAEPQRDLTPEDAAELLRGQPEVHYRATPQGPR
jgi:UDPglucose--hexose-1-phosphate uridylyltransferase